MSIVGIAGTTLAVYGGGNILYHIVSKTRSKFKKSIKKGNTIGLIPLHGTILNYKSASSPLGSKSSITPEYVKEAIDRLKKTTNLKGVIFQIDSPGGMPVPSKEIGDMIKQLQIPTVGLVGSYAASGGYWIVSACDKVVANPLSIVGSIGVRLDHINYKELGEKFGIKFDGFKAGLYKDMGSPWRDYTEEEREITQGQLAALHDYFIETISQNRRIPKDEVAEVANGLTYTGQEGLKLNLVDVLGGTAEAIKLLEELGNFKHKEIEEFKCKEGLVHKLLGQAASVCGESFFNGISSSVLKHSMEKKIIL